MGWKSLRDHYQIAYIVRVRGEQVILGSGYVPDLVTVERDGSIRQDHNIGVDERFRPTLARMRMEPDRVAQLLAAPDVFAKDVPVWTYDGAEIIEARCEEFGWPNVTHDGALMYENTHFLTRDEAVVAATDDAKAGVKWRSQIVRDCEKALDKARESLKESEDNLARLTGKPNL